MGTEPRPFLKWAGGKQKLLPQFESYFPENIHRYLEPFLGGAAVFFHLRKTGRITGEALLCDNNSELVNAYRIVRD
ncbi:MAG: DNA adenine methylase, partial [Spirochaetales bacterium]